MGGLGSEFHFASAGAPQYPPGIPFGKRPRDTLTLTGVIIIVLYPWSATSVATDQACRRTSSPPGDGAIFHPRTSLGTTI